jgi:hypothetical protein
VLTPDARSAGAGSPSSRRAEAATRAAAARSQQHGTGACEEAERLEGNVCGCFISCACSHHHHHGRLLPLQDAMTIITIVWSVACAKLGCQQLQLLAETYCFWADPGSVVPSPCPSVITIKCL